MKKTPLWQWQPKKLSAFKIAVLYALAGGLWILFSDKLLAAFVPDPALLTRLQTLKGWFYVLATAGVLYVLIHISISSFKRSEEALEESRRTLQTLLSNLPGMAYRFRNDRETTTEFVSDGCHELTGYPASALMFEKEISYTNLIHPQDLEYVSDERQTALQEKRPFRIVYRILDSQSTEKWVMELGLGVASAEGEIVALEGFISDITERKLAVEALKRSESKFRSLFERSADAILLLDGNVFIDCNAAAVKMMHCKNKKQLLSLHPSELSPERQPDGRLSFEKANELIDRAYKEGNLRFRWIHRRSDGEDFPVEVLLTVIPIDDKPIIYTVWRDITDRVQAEEALKESEQRYRTLVEGTSDAIVMIDRERKMISSNQAFLDLFAFEMDEVLGKSVRIIHPSEESYLSFGEKALPILRKREPFRTEWRLRRKDGTEFPVEGSYSGIRGHDGSITAYVAIMRDITERKKAEEELGKYRNHLEEMVAERTHDLEEAQRALVQKEKLKTLGAMTAEIAHEIRNPLVSLGGFARRLQKKHPESPEVGIILKECMRLEVILDRINTYLKPVEVQPRECLANRVITECVDLLTPELAKEGAVLNLELDAGVPPAYVDPDVLAQVVTNVITNAAKVMDKERPLAIKTYADDHHIHIELRNPVLGKKIKDPELLFLPFDEGEKSIGVSHSYRLLKNMGGVLSFMEEEGYMVFDISLLKAPPPALERDEKNE